MNRLASLLLLIGAAAALLAAVLIQPRVGHPVTPWMSQAATEVSGKSVAALPEMSPGKPTIAIFILPGCPCSEAYDPYTHELFRAYGANAQIVGVVEGNTAELQKWRDQHHTPYPLVEDPDHALARSFGAKRSAYTALVIDGQTVERLWPGYSAQMLQEVGSWIAKSAKVPEVSINVTDAPSTLTSGCILD